MNLRSNVYYNFFCQKEPFYTKIQRYSVPVPTHGSTVFEAVKGQKCGQEIGGKTMEKSIFEALGGNYTMVGNYCLRHIYTVL